MTILKTLNHVVWDCTYHIVIVPKYRKKVLYGASRKEMIDIIQTLAKQKGIEIIRGNAVVDHFHMVVSIPPKFSISHTVGFLKGKSAILIHNRMTKRRRPLTQKSFWSRGYFVRTVGIDKETIKRYVEDQWKKDKYNDGEQLDLRW
jgi:putative transposase